MEAAGKGLSQLGDVAGGDVTESRGKPGREGRGSVPFEAGRAGKENQRDKRPERREATSAFRALCLPNPIEHSVYETVGVLRTILLHDLDGLVDSDLGGDVPLVEQGIGPDPQHGEVDSLESLEGPILEMGPDGLVHVLDALERSGDEEPREGGDLVVER